MLNEWTLYWILKLDNFHFALFVFCLLFLSCAIALIIVGSNDSKVKFINIGTFLFVPLFVVSLIGVILLPSTKQMAMIYVIPKLVNSTSEDVPVKLKKMAIKEFSLIMKSSKKEGK
jgi:hypothetical protein